MGVLEGLSFVVCSAYPIFAYVSVIHKASSDDAGRFLTNAHTEDLLMTLMSFLAACCDGPSGDSLGFEQFDCRHGGFIVLLPTGISPGSEIVGQYDEFSEAGLSPVLTILALPRSSELDWAGCVDVEYPLFVYIFLTRGFRVWNHRGWLNVSVPVQKLWCRFLVVRWHDSGISQIFR